MTDASTPTYHLWLKPSGAALDVLGGTIRRLARELQVPAFEPHVTLLAYLEGSEREHRLRTAELAERLTPTECVLSKAAYLDEHFRCLFMLVDPTPGILSCHAMAAQAFGKEPEPYMPHVSLVYGSFPESRKLESSARCRQRFGPYFWSEHNFN